ncbi:MAG: hypothetical protein DMG17_22685 [Acidobacteria bacterium]|nr:MAG: hypothetical protein DMG17_22685 [Acidobacteriota bacterium]
MPIERLCELLQRFPLFKQILGRFAAKRDQLGDWRAPVTYHDRPIFARVSHPRTSAAMQLADRDLLHV